MTPTAPGALIHQLLRYSSDEQLLAVTLPFAGRGLRDGERVASICSAEHNQQLRSALGPAAEAVIFIDNRDWYRHPMWTLAAYDKYLRDSGGRLRMIGELPWQDLDRDQAREWHRVEAVANVAFADRGAWVICPYDTGKLEAPILEAALQTHPESLSPEGPVANHKFQDPRAFCRSEAKGFPEPPSDARRFIFKGRLGPLRHFVSGQALAFGLQGERAEVLMLAAGEVGANSVEHGGGAGEAWVWATTAEVVCQISDRGIGLGDSLAGYLPPDPQAMQHCGLWLVRQLCDRVEVRAHGEGTEVRIHLAL